jgi:hypothetical protein
MWLAGPPATSHPGPQLPVEATLDQPLGRNWQYRDYSS